MPCFGIGHPFLTIGEAKTPLPISLNQNETPSFWVVLEDGCNHGRGPREALYNLTNKKQINQSDVAFTQAVVSLTAVAEAVRRIGNATAQSQKPAAPRRGMSRVEAAQYIGVSASTFDSMVKGREMPQPVRIGSRTVWDIHALDASFDALVNVEAKNPWAA